MRLRLVVVAAFLALAAVPAYFAYTTGILPGPAQASAESSTARSVAHAIGRLAWPVEPMGLTATDTTILWEQRDPSPSVAGLWSYDVRTQRTGRVLGRSATGKSAGFPSASGDVVAWSAWAGRREAGEPQIQAYDAASTRLWTVAQAGSDPTVAGESVLWVEPGGTAAGNDLIRGSNSLTDEEYSIKADGHVRAVAAWGTWAVWIAGPGKSGAVWAGSYAAAARYKLAAAGTAVAIDRDRILWAAHVGRHSTAVVSWDRHSSRSKVLCRVVGSVSSLALSRRYAAWVTTREAPTSQVWVYDFGAGRASTVSSGGSRQASPVIVAGSVYWADDRSGHWELYARSLRP